ncbi:MAG TPA: acyl-ACP--UDP-N-acetylglucosamine O-acyltransferase [Nitrospiria bacterium]|nr:acyl-ACP--UDP-N-acetylglucosamine O-acyltransferase [Nitrospiria bacterium]
MTDIHPTAIVDPGAKIEEGVQVGPYAIIGDEVVIGRGTRVGSHAVIEGPIEIGTDCRIFPFASIGFVPQDLKFRGEKTRVEIGNGNVIREYVTIHRGTEGGGGLTRIGNNNLLMAYVHIAHDCIIGNNVILANAATLAGHITVQDHALVGGLSAVHQFVRIGRFSMVGGGSAVSLEVPPFVSVAGNRAKLFGLNTIGMKRAGFSAEQIGKIKKAYQMLFRSKLSVEKAVKKVKAELGDSKDALELAEFVETSERGICR